MSATSTTLKVEPVAEASGKTAAPLNIPTVDLAPFLRDPNSAESQVIVETVRDACLSTGFFLAKGHGIPTTLQQDIFKASANFFKLPFEQKKALDAKSNVGHRGYDVLASQQYETGIMPDLKEGFYVGPKVPKSDPKYGRFYMGEGVWPAHEQLPAASFQHVCEEYYTAVFDLSLRVFELLARTLPYGPNVFDEFVANGPAAPMRLLHYPPAAPTDGRAQYGASAHTDFGAITLLLQDGNPGLQILDQRLGEWKDVPPTEDTFVINVGDMLTMWTAGRYKSSVHRVINPKPTDRYSIVFFFDGNLDCPLDPLDGTPGEGKTVEAYMLQKMKESYGNAKK